MLTIGVDIDGVLYQWEKTARYMLREVLPNSPYTKDGPLGRVSESWGYIQSHVRPEHWDWLWKEGARLGLFRHGYIYPGAVEAVRALAKLGDVIVITHRPKTAVHDTLSWLAYQNLPLSGVHMLTNQEPKSSVHPQCRVYIDDKPENCVDLYNNTEGQVALMDRAWNQHYAAPTGRFFRRVSSWGDFINFVLAVK